MKFEELERLLNEEIENNEDLRRSNRFNDKQDLKRWLASRIRSIISEKIGEEYLSKNYEDKDTKIVVDYDWSGKENNVYIKVYGYILAQIKFNYTYTTEYSIFWSYTHYGIKKITLEKKCDSDNFINSIEEYKQRKINDEKETKEYRDEKLEKAKKFFKSRNLTIDDINEAINMLCFIDYEERKTYEEELNNGKEASWYNFR